MTKFAVLAAVLTLSGCAGMQSKPTDPETAIREAEAALQKAAAVGGEWRDSSAFIDKAKRASAAGDKDKAIDLAIKAKHEGELGHKQATSQKNAGPWLF